MGPLSGRRKSSALRVGGKSITERNDDRDAHCEVVITIMKMAKIIVFALAIFNVVTMMAMLTAKIKLHNKLLYASTPAHGRHKRHGSALQRSTDAKNATAQRCPPHACHEDEEEERHDRKAPSDSWYVLGGWPDFHLSSLRSK